MFSYKNCDTFKALIGKVLHCVNIKNKVKNYSIIPWVLCNLLGQLVLTLWSYPARNSPILLEIKTFNFTGKVLFHYKGITNSNDRNEGENRLFNIKNPSSSIWQPFLWSHLIVIKKQNILHHLVPCLLHMWLTFARHECRKVTIVFIFNNYKFTYTVSIVGIS